MIWPALPIAAAVIVYVALVLVIAKACGRRRAAVADRPVCKHYGTDPCPLHNLQCRAPACFVQPEPVVADRTAPRISDAELERLIRRPASGLAAETTANTLALDLRDTRAREARLREALGAVGVICRRLGSCEHLRRADHCPGCIARAALVEDVTDKETGR